MHPQLNRERLGDWNDLKGAAYHFAYALWMLLHEGEISVAFYQGNDLLARPISPPRPDAVAEPALALRAQTANEDTWIQLKSRSRAWSCSDVLACPGLIATFVFNALHSEQHGRSWRVRLVTQGELPAQQLRNPAWHSKLSEKIEQIVSDIQTREQASGGPVLDAVRIRKIIYEVLGQLAAITPVHLDVLHAQVDRFLTHRFLSTTLADQARKMLLGDMFEGAGRGPDSAQWYDGAWMEQVIGEPLKPDSTFDRDPSEACNLAVQAAVKRLDRDWSSVRFAQRPQLTAAFERFLSSSTTLFLLLGPSGSGKSWATAHWTLMGLADRPRLLIGGAELPDSTIPGLSGLVAERLRHLSAAPLRDEQILLRLQQEARSGSRGPLVVVIDDFAPQSGSDVSVCRKAFMHLVRECAAIGAKLVVTCQTHVWELFRLGDELLPTDLFMMDPELNKTDPAKMCSFALGDLTPEEQAIALGQRLPPSVAARVIDQLRMPGYLPLRRPYLLERYLDQQSAYLSMGGALPSSIDIDSLLDARVTHQLDHAARSLNVHLEEMRDVLSGVQELLWVRRTVGVRRGEIESYLEDTWFRSRGFKALVELQQVGLLSTGTGPKVSFAEPLVADRIFARALRARMDKGDNILDDLELSDAGAVSALIRSLGADTSGDPVALSEALIGQSPEWLRPVTEGLAQCSAQDYRVLGCLTALSRTEMRMVVPEACDALGELAARGKRFKRSGYCQQRAYEWVAQMYLSPSAAERYRGGQALRTTLRYEPRRVGQLLRIRLSRAARMPNFFSTDREKREQVLAGSLLPLYSADHRGAIDVAAHTLTRYADLDNDVFRQYAIDQGEEEAHSPTEYEFSVDTVRGVIALHDDAELDQVLANLQSPRMLTRYHAACALHSAAFIEPERVRDALCEAIRHEVDARILNRLLWATFPLREHAAKALLAAFRDSLASRWDPNQFVAGQALALLADLASIYPRDVAELVPRNLDQFDPEVRAWLSEGWAYTWWCCAEALPDFTQAYELLRQLSEPDLSTIPDLYHIFSLRGAVIAQLALMSLSGIASATELNEQQSLYPDMGSGLLYIYTSSFARRHAAQLVHQEGFERLRDLALGCLGEETRITHDPRIRPLRKARGTCAGLCLEILIALAIQCARPAEILRALPADWHRFTAARQVLGAGRRDPDVVTYVERLRDEPIGGRSVQALSERELCLKELANLRPDPAGALAAMRAETRARIWGSGERARAQAELADERPGEFLALLDDAIKTPRDLPTLYRWKDATRSWRGVLLLRVYARMFDLRPMDSIEASELCEQMLVVTRSLPPSLHRQDCEQVYSAIQNVLRTPEEVRAVAGSSALLAPASPISQSHAVALDFLTNMSPTSSSPDDVEHLLDQLVAGEGTAWWTGEGFHFEGDQTWLGSGETIYVFPAVRLAAVAAGMTSGERDPAAQLMADLARISEANKKYRHERDPRVRLSPEMLASASEELRSLAKSLKRYSRPLLILSEVLLREGQLAEAEDTLHQALVRSYTVEARALALYNLACVYSRTNREIECEETLREVSRMRLPDSRWLGWLREDPDFELVRGRPWFQAISTDPLS